VKAAARLMAGLLAMVSGCAGDRTGVTCEDAWERLHPESRRQFESRADFLAVCEAAARVGVCRDGTVAAGEPEEMCSAAGGVDYDLKFPDG